MPLRIVLLTSFLLAFVASLYANNPPNKGSFPKGFWETALREQARLTYGDPGWVKRMEQRRMLQQGRAFTKAAAQPLQTDHFVLPVLLGQYSDNAGTFTVQNFQNLLFDNNPTGTMTAYYNEVSYGQFDLTGKVYGWFTSDQPRSCYASNNNGLNSNFPQNGAGFVRSIVGKADPSVNFSLYDNDGPDGIPNSGDDDGYVDGVVVVYAGAGADVFPSNNNLWPHMNSLGTNEYTTNDASANGGMIKVNAFAVCPERAGSGSGLNQIRPIGGPVNIISPSGWKYTHDSPQSLGTMSAAELIVERNDITVGSTPKDTLDFSTTFNVSASPDNEANISINHDSLKARPGSKLMYLHDLFVDRGLTAWDETSLANAHTKALDSNFVLIVPPDYPASTMTFSASDATLKLINYDTLNITANQTVPKGASIVMAGTGVFNISSGVTFTFASGSRFYGGLHQRFTGSGTVKFQEDVVDEVYPQWWGVLGDSSTVSTSGFQKALNSGVKKIRVRVPAGTYMINDSLQIPSNVDFFGENATIVSTDTNNFIFRAGPLSKNIRIFGFTLRYRYVNKIRQPNTSAMLLREVDTLEVSHNRVLGAPGMGMQIVACKSVKISHNRVERTLADGIHITNGLNTDTQRHIWSEDFVISDNIVVNTGDDHIAVVSYQRPVPNQDTLTIGKNWTGSQQQIRRGVVANNVVRGALTKYRTRGITVLGARDIIVANNVIEGHPTVGDTNQTLVISGILE